MESVLLTILIDDDSETEPEETVTVNLEGGGFYAIGDPSSATGSIAASDVPTLTISDASTEEGGELDFVLTLSGDVPGGFFGVPRTSAGEASAGDGDFVGISGTP